MNITENSFYLVYNYVLLYIRMQIIVPKNIKLIKIRSRERNT
jgi:hypothetical protein